MMRSIISKILHTIIKDASRLRAGRLELPKKGGSFMGNERTINERSLKMIKKDISISLSMKREKNKQQKKLKARRIDDMADRLVRMYDAEGSRRFFLKCYWYLDENFIENVVKMSNRPVVNSPLKYFVSSCHNELVKIGV